MDEQLILEQTDNQTLTSFIMSLTGDREMAILMNAIQLSCKLITRAVRKAGIANLLGLAGDTNTSGDDMKKLDILSDEIMVNALIVSVDLLLYCVFRYSYVFICLFVYLFRILIAVLCL